jgi:hypothetical protein
MISCARATRGLRRMGRERPGALLARRTRTVKRCSFDARSKGQPWPLPHSEVEGIGRPSLGLMARLDVPVGGRVRMTRAVGDHLVRPQGKRWKSGGRLMRAVKGKLSNRRWAPFSASKFTGLR